MSDNFIPTDEFADPDIDRDLSHPAAKQILALINEYRGTARRVGANLDDDLVLKVVNAALRESAGVPLPLREICSEQPTERFLAESLFNEILEVPVSGVPLVRGSKPDLISLDEWRYCLKEVAESLTEIRVEYLYEN